MTWPTAGDLATLLRRTFSSAETAAADLILAGVVGAIKRAAHQQIELVTDDVVQLRGVWNQDLKLPQRPVLAVGPVSLRDPAGVSIPMVADRDYVWNRFGDLQRIGFIARIPRPIEGYWGGPAATVTVTYSHGYATIPADVWGICLDVAARGFTNPLALSTQSVGTHGQAVDSEGNAVLAYREPLAQGTTLLAPGFTDQELRVLKTYRPR